MGSGFRCLWQDLHSRETRERRRQEDEKRCLGGLGQHASLARYGSGLGSGIFHDERWKIASYWEGCCIGECIPPSTFQNY